VKAIKTFATYLLVGTLALFGVCFTLLGYYYISHLRPSILQTDDILAHLTQAEKDPPKAIYTLVQIDAKGLLAHRVARELIWQRPLETDCSHQQKTHGTLLGWHGCMFLFGQAMNLSFNQEELTQLWLRTAPFGYEHLGFEAAAHTRFSRPLAALSTEELAELVALGKSPELFKNRPDLLEPFKQRLLTRLQENNTTTRP